MLLACTPLRNCGALFDALQAISIIADNNPNVKETAAERTEREDGRCIESKEFIELLSNLLIHLYHSRTPEWKSLGAPA